MTIRTLGSLQDDTGPLDQSSKRESRVLKQVRVHRAKRISRQITGHYKVFSLLDSPHMTEWKKGQIKGAEISTGYLQLTCNVNEINKIKYA